MQCLNTLGYAHMFQREKIKITALTFVLHLAHWHTLGNLRAGNAYRNLCLLLCCYSWMAVPFFTDMDAGNCALFNRGSNYTFFRKEDVPALYSRVLIVQCAHPCSVQHCSLFYPSGISHNIIHVCCLSECWFQSQHLCFQCGYLSSTNPLLFD